MRWRRLIVAMGLVALGACGADDESVSPTTSTTLEAVEEPFVVDWTGSFETQLPNGWVVRDCEGDRTHVCVYNGDAFLGDMELLSDYPLAPGEEEKDPQVVAREWATRFVSEFRDDRAQGCAAFVFDADPVSAAPVGGQPGARAGFTLKDGSGRAVERVINYYVLVDGTMSIVNTDAYVEEGGCLAPSEIDPAFGPEDLAEIEPYLDRLVANSPARP